MSLEEEEEIIVIIIMIIDKGRGSMGYAALFGLD